MSSHTGIITGPDTLARATRLAGCLAELGVTRLDLRAGYDTRPMEARRTNLPGEIARAMHAAPGSSIQVLADSLGAVFEFTPDGASWTCGDPHLAHRLREKLHATQD
jgi:hypothetical protein